MDEKELLRQQAAECQRMADATQNPDDKAQWLRLAEKWLRMIKPEVSASESAKIASDKFDDQVREHGTGQDDSDSSH